MPELTVQARPESHHMLRFAASVTSKASPQAVYDVLADVRSHLVWTGERAPVKSFRLLTLDGPEGVAGVGATFRSTGASGPAGTDTFIDVSTVTESTPGQVFAFGTDARLERKHGKTWLTHFEHRYELAPEGPGTRISYTCDVLRGNYRPYWLHPLSRPLTRTMVGHMIKNNLKQLASLAAP